MDFRSVSARDKESTRIGKMHGADRATNRSYILTEVIFEYHILREVISEFLEVDGLLPGPQRDIIFDSIEQAVNDAAVEFSEVHADIQEKFINTLTHDLKNPLSAASANAELILRRSETLEPNRLSARRIIGSLNRLRNMIHDLLDASRVRAGELLHLEFVRDDLESMVREVIEEMSTIHGDRFLLESKGPIEGNWDIDALRRSLENLIGNAIKYGSADTPITISLRGGKTSAELTVHNEGTPISASDAPLLFQQYRRARRAQEGTQTGWGLGLTLVKGVVDAHKGTVRVESEQGKGTKFILEIPFGEAGSTVSELKSPGKASA
jgi:signal transduction histidine kinase